MGARIGSVGTNFYDIFKQQRVSIEGNILKESD